MNKKWKNWIPLALWLLFETIAVVLWLSLNKIFYFYNFTYIGTCLALGVFLYSKKVKFARHVVQFAIGSYMLLYLGVFSAENMQIEGFWYYLFLGVFEAAVIHYVVAKLFGPFLFGRGWCGYACWTAMILDLLPYRVPAQPRKKWGWFRFVVLILSFVYVSSLFLWQVKQIEKVMLYSFILGNGLYYLVGITLAFKLKDNRAFCKYICPISLLMKPASAHALLRIKNDESQCVSCGNCKKVCPMNVDMVSNAKSRLNGTECILCFECIQVCPKKALYL